MDNNYNKIGSAIDRFQEAHFWIHMMEQFYHAANPFRWHLNVFLKAVKEVPQIIQMELQNVEGFSQWFKEIRSCLYCDPLLQALSKQRDFIVHKGMLVPKSEGTLGITEGRGMKLGLTFPVNPLEDSEHAMERYLYCVLENSDVLGILDPDDDSLPCIYRQWHLEGFEEEIVDLSAKAWLRLGKMVETVLKWLGEDKIPALSLDCRHSSQKVQYKIFNRDALRGRLEELRNKGPNKAIQETS